MALRISGRLVNPAGIKATILVPTYQLISNVNSVNEGNPVVFTLTTTNVPNGTQVPFTITGVTSNDIVGGQLTGNFTVNNNTANTTITVAEDAIADEVESLTMTIDGTAASKTVVINDTTVLYQLTSDIDLVNEGSSVIFTLTTTNVPNSTQIPFTIIGVTSEDIVGGQLTGNFTINNNTANTTITIAADSIPNEVEVITLTLNGLGVSKTVNITETSPADQYFKYSSFLLTATGLNTTQNNTFVDSSSNNFALTRNGNPTQGSFSPFSPTGWSGFFNTSGLSILNPTSMNPGNGNFTIEFWMNIPIAPTGNVILTCGPAGSGGVSRGYNIELTASNLIFSYQHSGTVTATFGATSAITRNVWHHVAIVRNANAITCYLNGSQFGNVYTYPYADGIDNVLSTDYFGIGGRDNTNNGIPGRHWFIGQLANLRITNTAVYTGTFTPSVSPLIAISGTKLLTLQDNRFKDNSTNNYSLAAVGSPQISASSPFESTGQYSTTTHGGSLYFDGSGDYISLASQTALNPGTGDFTLEFWLYNRNAWSVNGDVLDGSSGALAVYFSASQLKIAQQMSTSVSLGSVTSLIPNAWNHFVIVRSAGMVRAWANGAALSTAVSYGNSMSAFTKIGGTADGYIKGNIANLRFTKGTDLYGIANSTITMPSAPLASDLNTSLLLNGVGANIIDSTGRNVIETIGNAQVTTVTSKFGKSVYFDGSGDYLTLPTTGLLGFGTGNFTIEMWAYTGSNPTNLAATLFDTRISGGSGTQTKVTLGFSGTTPSIVFYTAGATRISHTAAINQWYHIALVRNNGVTTLFVDGTSRGTYADTNDYGAESDAVIGQVGDNRAYSQGYFYGFIEDLRVTKGVARYTTTFTPPTAALPR